MILLFVLETSPLLEGVDFDLRRVPVTRETDDAIVVAARRRDQRITELSELRDETLMPPAEMHLFGKVKGGVEVEQQSLAGGAVSNRAMVKVKIPF